MSIFYGYAATHPAQAEIVRTAAGQISKRWQVESVLWQDMAVDGRVIMQMVMAEIDRAQMCIFDLTDLSENVLFEAGYAVARRKPVWLVFDKTIAKAKKDLKQLA